MNTSVKNEPQSQLVTTVQAIVESENSIASILFKAVEELAKIQSSAWASGLHENLTAFSPDPMPQNPVLLLWQVPSLMQQKAKRRVGHWQDVFSVLSNSQQQMLAWASQSYIGNVAQASASFSTINDVFISRRQSAEVINFPDRRIQVVLAQAASTQERAQEPQRMARRAA